MENEMNEMNAFEKIVAVIKGFFDRVGTVLGAVFQWVFRLRKIFMALPVMYFAWQLAVHNMENLPKTVGFDLQATGEFAQMVSRETAVYGPLGLTCLCLILMFLSRRTVYPWLISIFSLVLPILLWITNTFPN